MAILNVTPDSFSDGGQHLDPARAIAAGLRFAEEGADIVDIGGESTKPGSRPTPVEEELDRVLPVVEALVAKGVVVSVDTRRAAIARPCLDVGARIVNDTSALRDDPNLLTLVAERGVPVVLMHRRGISEDKYEGAIYGDVVEDVRHFLRERVAACLAAGIARDRIALDPGIGFGKTPQENLRLIAHAGRFAEEGHAVVVGSSRKGFIGRLTGEKVPARRDPASVWLAVEAARHGASIVRVHDVAGTRQALAISAAMR
ncbi:MAG TPA: dihydropteroate synthase [Reyranella sp.]|nr:dihydropteroate synthase [Reyranella sp.]